MRPRAIRSRVRQLRARSEPALIAAVGLDTGARERASRLLSERFHDQGRPLWSKAEVGFVALELEDPDGPASEEYAESIVQALRGNDPENLWTSWRNHLIEGSTRLDPSIAARLLAAAMERETDAGGLLRVASALATVASRLEQAEAIRNCRKPALILANALAVEADVDAARNTLGPALVKILSQLEPAEAARMLATALAQQKDDSAQEPLVNGLSTIAAHLEPAEAARICGQAAKILTDNSARAKYPQDYATLAAQLAKVTVRLDPAQAARVWGELARILATALARYIDGESCEYMARTLETVSAQV